MSIQWRDAMSIGVPELDDDHKKMVAMVNDSEDAVAKGDVATVRQVMTRLIEYVTTHFRREEKLLLALGPAPYGEHKRLHDQLLQKVKLLQDKFGQAAGDAEALKLGQLLHSFLREWLVSHIIKEDLKYAALLSGGKKAAPVEPPKQTAGAPAEVNQDDAKRREQRKAERERDLEYQLPPNLAHLLKRLEYVVPQLPDPVSGFDSFEKLCESAIHRRVDKVLVFFQRHNPERKLGMPPVFLASPKFAEKFRQAVSQFIFPAFSDSRQLRMLATNVKWAELDTDIFWDHVSRPLQENLLEAWNNAWDDLKLIETKKTDGSKVWQIKPQTKQLRELLAPDEPEDYDIPKVGNRDIDCFKSLLDPTTDWWDKLNRAWQLCHDLYEQEKDPRVFQQKAREGALRDNLLNAFSNFPDQWGDFLVLSCHTVFPRVSTQFLERFVTNLGQSEATREAYAPYTMRYLSQVRQRPEVRERERQEEEEWQAKVLELRNYLTGRSKDEKPVGPSIPGMR